MTSSWTLRRAFAVLEDVVQRSGDDRRRRMEELCGADVGLRKAVEGLLENDERAEREGFLDSSPVLTMDPLPQKTILDDFEFTSCHNSLLPPSFCAAIVHRADQTERYRFIENVAINRGFNMRTFLDEAEALGWLLDR